MKVLQFPLAKMTLCFIAGILFAYYFQPDLVWIFWLLGLSLFVFGISLYFSHKNWLQTIYFGIATFGVSFLIGVSCLLIHSGFLQQNNYIHQVQSSEAHHVIEVVLRERLKPSNYNDRFYAIVKRIDNHAASGKILVNLRKAEFKNHFVIGTNLQIDAAILKHKKPNNPDQFDYGKYLTDKSILAQVYAGADEVKLSRTVDKDLYYYSDVLRNRILENLRKSNFGESELSVAAALILGQKQDLSPDVVKDYQYAGAVHILSVSGLHVGFILLFLTFLLNFLPNGKWHSYFKLFTILVCLWGFAILAGLSPSVIRSVTMFSFVAVGMHLKRQTNIFHTLFVSILLILLFEPAFLFDVGFQLSYAAVFFIVWLQPVFLKMWIPKHKIIRYFWQIITVSVAAQIGTLPLTFYYFHQFPGLFFFTNLIVIPFLSFVMALGVCVAVLAAFNYVPMLLMKPLVWSIFILNKFIAFVASFSQYVIRDISFNQCMMLALYFSIIACVLWVVQPNFKKLVFAICTLLAFQITYLSTLHEKENQKEWIVFDVKKTTLIAERTGKLITAYGNKTIAATKMLETYASANFSKITSQKTLGNFAYFDGKKIMILDNSAVYPKNQNPDVLLITDSPKINLERLLQHCKPKMVVVDGSNFKTYAKLWKATCRKQNIPFHATAEIGYFKL